MCNHLVKISFSWLIIVAIAFTSWLGIGGYAEALAVESQPYFIKQLEKDRILSVSPNFRGELTQASLLTSLTEISDRYHIKATKAIQAEKLNGKIVPGLIVYVETKSPITESETMVAGNL